MSANDRRPAANAFDEPPGPDPDRSEIPGARTPAKASSADGDVHATAPGSSRDGAVPEATERRFLMGWTTALLVLAVVVGGVGLVGRSLGVSWLAGASIAVMIALVVTTLALHVARRHPDPPPQDPRGMDERPLD